MGGLGPRLHEQEAGVNPAVNLSFNLGFAF